MALREKYRSSIYRGFAPLIGEEEAEALLAEFPTRDADELVTREHLRAELASLRTEMHQLGGRLFVGLSGVMIGVAGFAVALVRLGA